MLAWKVDVISGKEVFATEITIVLSLCLIDGFVCGCENEMVVDCCKSIRRFWGNQQNPPNCCIISTAAKKYVYMQITRGGIVGRMFF